MSTASPQPTEVKLRRAEAVLAVTFEDGFTAELSAEYLRVYSPSAEVKGHGDAPRQYPAGKKTVAIERLEPVGRYAVRLIFSDGHDTGIYTWPYLYELAQNSATNWQAYLQALAERGLSREAA